MAQIPGTRINSSIVPNDSGDIYSTHQAQYGKGGWRTVADTTERNAITSQRREEGMVVWVSNLSAAYQLIGGVDNANWTTLNLSPNLSGYALIQDVENLDLDLQSQITSLETSASVLNDYVIGHQNALSVITSVSGALIGSVVHISGDENIYNQKNFDHITFGRGHTLTDLAHFNTLEIANGWNGFISNNSASPTGSATNGIVPAITGGQAFHIITDDRGYLYVSSKTSDKLIRIDPVNNKVKEFVMPISGYESNTMVYCPLNKSLYITHDVLRTTNISNGLIRQFDVQTETFIGSYTVPKLSSNVGDNVRGLTFCPSNGFIYAAYDSSLLGTPEPTVFVFNPITNSSVTSITGLANRPWSCVYIPSSDKIYIGHIVSLGVEVIDPYTNTVITSISASNMFFNQHLVECPKNKLVYSVTSNYFADRRINIIDPTTNTVVDQIIPPATGVRTLQTIFWNPRTEKLYALGYQSSGTIPGCLIIDPITNTVVKQIKSTDLADNWRWATYNYNTGLIYAIVYHAASSTSDVIALA